MINMFIGMTGTLEKSTKSINHSPKRRRQLSKKFPDSAERADMKSKSIINEVKLVSEFVCFFLSNLYALCVKVQPLVMTKAGSLVVVSIELGPIGLCF